MPWLGWKNSERATRQASGPASRFSCDEIREFTLAVMCVLNWGYHIGSHAWKGLLWLLWPSPWQHHALCLQLAFRQTLISNMVCSGLQRPHGKGTKKKTPDRQDDRQTDGNPHWKCSSRAIYFTSGHFRWCALYCILTIMQVCVIWAYKPNQVETIWTTLAFMKPFSLLYCSALLSKQSHMHTHTHTNSDTYRGFAHTHQGTNALLALLTYGL